MRSILSLFSLLLVALAVPVSAQAGGWSALNLTATMMMGVSATSANVAFFNTEAGNAVATVLKTVDGGNTFANVTNNGKALFPMGLAMYSETSGISTGLALGSGATAYTTDGKTFNPSVETPKPLLEQAQTAYLIGGTNGKGYATVGTYNNVNGISVSLDGGASFNIYNVSSVLYGSAPAFGSFPSPNTFVVVSPVIPPASNNNNSKTHMHRGEPVLHQRSVGAYDLLFTASGPSIKKYDPANKTGTYGEIDLSTDQGKTWTRVYSTFDYNLGPISCVDESTCFVIGYDAAGNNYIFQTTDLFQTIKQVANYPNVAGLSFIECFSIDQCIVLGGGSQNSMPFGVSAVLDLKAGTFVSQTVQGIFFFAADFLDINNGYASGMTVYQVMQAAKYSA